MPSATDDERAGPPPGPPRRIAVADLVVDTATRQVLRHGEPLAMAKMSFDLLLALIEAAPAVVTTDDLADRVWNRRVVSNENIAQRVRLLRKALNDDAQNPRYVTLVRGEGYRLLPEVRPLPQAHPASVSSARRWMKLLALAAVLPLASAFGIWWYWGPEPAATPDATARSIAVIPFANLSDDPHQQYFADGLTEEVINELTRIPSLRVAARTRRLGLAAPGPEPAGELDVGLALQGSVRWDGDSARITAQLIDVDHGFHLWSETYAYRFDSPLAIQESIARAVARELSLTLTARPDSPAPRTRNGLAYAHQLRGQALFWQHTKDTNEQAIEELRRAVELDPDYVRAWVLLGHAYGARARDPAQTAAALRDMADASRRALSLAPNYWEAHALDAWVSMSALDFRAADARMARALALRDRFGQERAPFGCPVACFEEQLGRYSAALEESQRTQEFEPLGPTQETWSGLYYLGRRDEAIAAFERMQLLRGRQNERRWFDFSMALENPDPTTMSRYLTPELAARWGKPDEFLPAFEPLLHDPSPRERGRDAYRAMFAAWHGDHELALAFLRKAFLRPGYGAFFLMWHPALAETRATEGFVDFVAELGMVDAWRASDRWPDFCRPDAAGQIDCEGIRTPPRVSEAAAAPSARP